MVFSHGKGWAGENQTGNMVYIPAGEFIMGSSPADGRVGISIGVDELPKHRVYLKAFYIDRYEVTNEEYEKFVKATGHPPPVSTKHKLYSWVNGKPPRGQEKLPVTNVTWYDADAYCRWAGKRLPTEAEWEKAARGTDGRQWPWGNKFIPGRCNTKYQGAGKILPVGSVPGDRSPYGVYDMCGNVSEWTSSWYKPYPGSKLKRKEFGEKYKVVRGGSWVLPYLPYSRVPYRANASPPEFKHRSIGFRCAKDADK